MLEQLPCEASCTLLKELLLVLHRPTALKQEALAALARLGVTGPLFALTRQHLLEFEITEEPYGKKENPNASTQF